MKNILLNISGQVSASELLDIPVTKKYKGTKTGAGEVSS